MRNKTRGGSIESAKPDLFGMWTFTMMADFNLINLF